MKEYTYLAHELESIKAEYAMDLIRLRTLTQFVEEIANTDSCYDYNTSDLIIDKAKDLMKGDVPFKTK